MRKSAIQVTAPISHKLKNATRRYSCCSSLGPLGNILIYGLPITCDDFAFVLSTLSRISMARLSKEKGRRSIGDQRSTKTKPKISTWWGPGRFGTAQGRCWVLESRRKPHVRISELTMSTKIHLTTSSRNLNRRTNGTRNLLTRAHNPIYSKHLGRLIPLSRKSKRGIKN